MHHNALSITTHTDILTGHPVDIFEPYAILVHHWYLLRELHARFSPETGGVAVIDCEVNDTYEHLNYILD
jgi:hypothetical protein